MIVSASREKKTRQELSGQGLTEKQIQAQKEEQRAKRNRVIYTILGVVCAVLAAALLIWNSGFFQSRTPALTVGSTTYTAADLQYYYNEIYSQTYYNAYYMAMLGYGSGFDYTLSAKEQYYDELNGKTWYDYFVDTTVDTLTQLTALIDAADAAGYQLSDEGRQSVREDIASMETTALTQGYTSLNSYLKGIYGRYMTRAKYEEILLRDQRAFEFRDHYVDSLEFSDQDLESYYTENADTMDLFQFHYAYFNGVASSTTDEEGNTVQPTEEESAAALEEAQAKAEALQAALESGTPFDEAVAEYDEDSKVTVYAEQSVAGSSLSSLYSEWMLESGRKAGDVTLVTSSTGTTFYVVQFLSRDRDENYSSANVRHALIAAEQDEDASEPTEEQYAAAKAEAEQLLADWQSNSPTEESFAKLAEENSADTSSAVEGGLITDVTTSSGYVTTFTDWALDAARQPGDTGIVQNTGSSIKGWHIMYFVGSDGEANWKANSRSSLTSAALNDWIDGLTSALAVTRESGISNVG